MSRGIPAKPIQISPKQYSILEKTVNKNTISHQLKIRIKIILAASKERNNSEIKRGLGISLNKVKRWRKRWESEWESLCAYESGLAENLIKPHDLLIRMQEILSDQPRSGTPKRITLSQQEEIVAVACRKPEEYGIPVSNWTGELLSEVLIREGIVQTITSRYVNIILKKKVAPS